MAYYLILVALAGCATSGQTGSPFADETRVAADLKASATALRDATQNMSVRTETNDPWPWLIVGGAVVVLLAGMAVIVRRYRYRAEKPKYIAEQFEQRVEQIEAEQSAARNCAAQREST